MNANENLNSNHFQHEARDLLTQLEQELLLFPDDPNSQRVHTLMRTAHTLKGAAATVEKTAIQNVAHILEDVFIAFFNPDLAIDQQVEALLFEGLDCLRLLLQDGDIDESAIMNRAASVIAQLQEKFGDDFRLDNPIPSSAELGFDMVAAMFESGVAERLQTLEQAIANASVSPNSADALDQLKTTLVAHADLFKGLAESLDLSGFRAIATLTLDAITHHPDQILA
ncbi:MAG: hybrid sensor histidine kinase/response regulator, partial [Cyanothece sp. SIO2G6]|nr:hybrid sensor histidine kinase/response regulator [Cyanothece sp. SIO2G6]